MRSVTSILMGIAFFYCVTLSAQDRSDSIKIVQLLVDDYAALGSFDVEKHMNNCTSDYKLIENGEIWDLKKEVEYFKSFAARKRVRKNQFDINSVKVVDRVAYALYEVRSAITENGTTKKYHWAESAVFRKEDNRWKIALIHSTEIALK
ncbi:hypothetical protein BH09BAC3_BH09BAC3_00700 [soil metagenome]